MKSPKYSPVWAVSLVVSLLLLIAGLVVASDDQSSPGMHLTGMRIIGFLLGVWIVGQLFFKGSVCVVAWEVKGPIAFVLAGLGALLGVVSAYGLFMSVFRG